MAGGIVRFVFTGDATGLKKATSDAESAIGGLEKSTGGLASKLAAGFSAVAITKFAYNAVKASSEIEESTNKLTQLIGSSAEDIQDWAKTTSSSFGISRSAALQSVGVFANLFNSLKKGEAETARMSRTFTQLAADMASFNNTSVQDAALALQSALAGRTMPLRRFGILLDAATLKQRAFNMGLVESTVGVLPPAIRVQAAYAEILEQSTKQQGDFTRTASSTANQMKTLGARFNDVKVALGEQLTPAAKGTVGIFESLLPVTHEIIEGVGKLINALPVSGRSLAAVAGAALIANTAFKTMQAGMGSAFMAIQKFQATRTGFDIGAQAMATETRLAQNALAPYIGMLSLLAGVATIAVAKHAQAQKEISDGADRLSTALKDANDPLAQYITFINKVASEETKAAKAAADLATARENVTGRWIAGEIDEDTLSALADATISVSKLGAAINEVGGEGFLRLARAIELYQGYQAGEQWVQDAGALERLSAAARQAGEGQFSDLASQIKAAAAASGDNANSASLSAKELQTLANALDDVGKKYKKQYDDQLDLIRLRTKLAFANNLEAQSWLNNALATAEGRNQDEKWLAILPKIIQYWNERGVSIDTLVDKQSSAVETANDLADAVDDETLSEKENKKALDEKVKAIEGELDANKRRLEAIDDQREALIRSFDTEAALVEADRDLAESQADLAEAAGGTADEYAAATSKVERALRDRAEAEVDHARALRDSVGDELTAAEANRIYRDKLIDLRDAISDPALQEYLNKIIGKMDAAAAVTDEATRKAKEWEAFWLRLVKLAKDDPALFRLQVVGGFNELPQGVTNPSNVQPPPAPPPTPLPIGGEFDFNRRRASGGPVSANTPYVVGERGPELFVPQRSGTIVPNKMINSNGGSVVINVNTPIGRPDDVVKWISQELRRYGRGQR